MTVAVAVAAVVPAGPEGKHGSYVDADEESHRRETTAVAAAAAVCHHRDTSVAATPVAVTCHRREASVAVAAAAAEVCYRRKISGAVAAVAAAYHRRETSVAAAAAAAEVCHHREIPYRRGGSMVPPAHLPPAIVSQFHGPCVESRRNGWCFLVSGGSVGGRPKSLFSRHRNVSGAGGE